MICDKCGKSNSHDISQCAYCGADMPKTSGGGGFVDILTYKGTGGATPSANKAETPVCREEKQTEGISEIDMQKLIKKSDNIMKSTKVNSLFGLVAIGLSILILVSSIIFGIITINTVKSYKEATMTQIEETKKELNEYKEDIDKVLAEITKTKNDVVNNYDEDVENNSPREDEPGTEGDVDTDNNSNKGKKNTNPSSKPNENE